MVNSFAPIIDPTGFGLRYCVITMINLIGNTGEGGLVVTNRVGLLKFDRQVTAQLTANEEEIIRISSKFLT